MVITNFFLDFDSLLKELEAAHGMPIDPVPVADEFADPAAWSQATADLGQLVQVAAVGDGHEIFLTIHVLTLASM